MCSAAATLGLTTSQFAITRVFGTLPSVCQAKQINEKIIQAYLPADLQD